METYSNCFTRTGRTIGKNNMDDDNIINTKDDKSASRSLGSFYGERPTKLTANGHGFAFEATTATSSPIESHRQRRASAEKTHDDNNRKRINPLRIHLGKRPFVDNSFENYNSNKKRKLNLNKSEGPCPLSRVPKLIPKRIENKQFHNVIPAEHSVDNEKDKPVPRLVPKSQLPQYKQLKKGKLEKRPQTAQKEYAQSLGLQPMVKFKCRKCCSMSFKTLDMLKEHQLVCKAQVNEPTLSPEAAPQPDNSAGGPSRVTRKVYLCSACGKYYENWNLFLHMREEHKRHICLFCLGMFSKAEKLAAHLTNKHQVQEFNYESKEDFFRVYSECYLMCCACEDICTELDDFFIHDCNNVKPKPVPLLISKNSFKINSIKQSKPCNIVSTNCHKNTTADLTGSTNQLNHDNKEIKDLQPTPAVSNVVTTDESEVEPVSSDTSCNTDQSLSKSYEAHNTMDNIDKVAEQDNVTVKTVQSPNHQSTLINEVECPELPNGNDNPDLPNGRYTPDSQNNNLIVSKQENSIISPKKEYGVHMEGSSVNPPEDKECGIKLKLGLLKSPAEKECGVKLKLGSIKPPAEKECGIKLKLSLNNAKSPVIINSTVDPTVGQHKVYKPPSRVRRPPKRYQKNPALVQPVQTTTPVQQPPPIQPRMPSIKMTISEKTVKTTIYENNQETVSTIHLNNNIESEMKDSEAKPEHMLKSTIYDNKLEESNTLNRVPKLTVRVPKELLDKDSSSDYSSDSDISDKLTVDENKTIAYEPEQTETKKELLTESQALDAEEKLPIGENNQDAPHETLPEEETLEKMEPEIEPKVESMGDINVETVKSEEHQTIDEISVTELTLIKPIDKYPLKDLLKVFLSSTIYSCIYCNHVRKIAVNCKYLALHMVAEHRFSATVDSITAEELLPETIINKVKTQADDLSLVYINLTTYDSDEKQEELQFDHIFECFQCYYKTPVHKELYFHNRKMHQKTILLCVMCKSNFYSYSELLCHLCPGTYEAEHDIKFRCCLCSVDTIPSSFRLMVHLRKIHHTCDVCLENCYSQARLSNHVWKHKLHHLCYRCGIAYRNKPDITKHLFWKHGTESVLCKKCLQKKWPHVYHFCSPPASFICDECNLQFTKAVYLKVHKRFHAEDFPHVCAEQGCNEKFVSKKLLMKHFDEHRKKLLMENLNGTNTVASTEPSVEVVKEVPSINLVENNDLPKPETIEAEPAEPKPTKKIKKKKLKDKDLLLDVNLPALNLSESDSSDESDSGSQTQEIIEKAPEDKNGDVPSSTFSEVTATISTETSTIKSEENSEQIDEKPSDQQVLQIWDNFQKYQAKVEKQKEKTPPLVLIRKHVCDSDHDYCLIPTDLNGEDDSFGIDKKKNKKSPKKKSGDISSSSSSSSGSDSSCSCGSNCSCSSSSGSSSSSSSGSDSSDESDTEKKKNKRLKKLLPNRRISTGSNVDVMGNAETPILIPEKQEPLIAETDLETDESDTDEEFYDEHPQQLANKLYEETQKRNQLMLLASVAPSDGGSMSGDVSRCTTPIQEDVKVDVTNDKTVKTRTVKNEKPTKLSSSKKKSKKKKKYRNSKKRAPIKINIPKDIIDKVEEEQKMSPPLAPNKITISLQSNKVQIPEPSPVAPHPSVISNRASLSAAESKRASKRRRVPNKFYGYSSDEEANSTTPTILAALKPQQPPKLEWRKEDLPSPTTHKPKKEVPSSSLVHKLYKFSDKRFATPIPDPEPPKILMNTESVTSDSDSSEGGALEIYQPSHQNPLPVPPPSYLNAGTSSLPYPFERKAVREAREGESVYCYCRCPYDEESEMIGCDAEGCPIEWFHFECVGIMVPPKGKWYCPECRKNQSFSGYR